MSNLNVRKIKGNRKKIKHIQIENVQNDRWFWPDGREIDSEQMILSMLLPPSVKEFYRRMTSEVEKLCGSHLDRQGECYRWGSQGGSVYLGGQKVGIEKPRVRQKGRQGKEVLLKTYEDFQNPDYFDRQVFIEGVKKVSQRDYSRGLPQIAGSFGFSKSKVSRSWIRSTQKKLDELLNRDLRPLDIVAVFIDGKRFRKYGVVVALGVSSGGKKYVLGIYQANTEHSANCLKLLEDLERRGLPNWGLVFIVDGGSGINLALRSKYSVHHPEERRAVLLRCHNHKLDNIETALEKKGTDERICLEVKSYFEAMRTAKDLTQAKAHCASIETLLRRANLSAYRSFLEAKEDLLMLHRLDVHGKLKRFFSTTNPIESLNSLTEEDLRRVKHWRDSSHFQRWLATSSLTAETRMRRPHGFTGLGRMITAVHSLCVKSSIDKVEEVA